MKFLPILGSVVESVLIKVLQEEELMSFTSSDPSPPPRSIYTKFLWRTNNSNTREEKKKQKESTRMEEVDGVVTRRKVLGDTNLPLADPNRDFTFDQKAKL